MAVHNPEIGGWFALGVSRGEEPPDMIEEMFSKWARGAEFDVALALCMADFMEDAAHSGAQ